MKLSDYVIDFIAHQGVKHVFLVPGGGAMHLNDSLGRNKQIKFVCNLHEQASAISAEAYARVTDNLGVAMVTTGPGGTNAITGVAGAWLESTPCLFLSGQVKTADLKGSRRVRQLGPQEVDIVALVKGITKYAVTITDPNSIRFHLEQAVALATSGRKGPVWIDIPLDIQGAQIEPETLPGFHAPVEEAQVASAAELKSKTSEVLRAFAAAKRPVILFGNGVRAAQAKEIAAVCLKKIGAPVLATWMGADLVGEDNPLFYGKPGTIAARYSNFIIQNCDLLLSVGARLDLPVTGFDQTQFAREAKKIIVDIDPAEIAKLKMSVSLEIVADAREFFTMLSSELDKTDAQLGRPEWIDYCKKLKARYPIVTDQHRAEQNFVNTYVLGDILSDRLAADDLIVPGSSGSGIDAFWLSFRVKSTQRMFSTGGLGAMGFGLPAAIAACIAANGKRVICIDGDGGFQLNIQELSTLKQLNLPVKIFIVNNDGYASIRSTQARHFAGNFVGCDSASGLAIPDLVAVARAYGIETYRLENHAQLDAQLSSILDSSGPVLVDVLTNPAQEIAPRIASVVKPGGGMESKPLEDLFPFLERKEFEENMLIAPLPASS